MKNPLISPLNDIKDDSLKEIIVFYHETLGFYPNSLLTMQLRPEIARAFVVLNKAVMANHGRVTSVLKRLIALISSAVAGCEYCQAHAALAAKRYGADEEKLRNVWDYHQHPAFNEAERVALDFARAASVAPSDVDEELKTRLKEYWNDGEIVEMLGVISLFGFLNRWNDSMGTPMEPDAEACGRQFPPDHGWSGSRHTY